MCIEYAICFHSKEKLKDKKEILLLHNHLKKIQSLKILKIYNS